MLSSAQFGASLDELPVRVLRWLLLLPSAIAAGFAASMLAIIPLSVAHGWERIDNLLNAPDMAGMYIVGTYCLLLVRGAAGAASTWVVYRIAPSHRLQASYAWLVLLALTFIVVAMYINLVLDRAQVRMSFSAGYRVLVEAIGLLGGSWLVIEGLKEEVKRINPLAQSSYPPFDLDNKFYVLLLHEIHEKYGALLADESNPYASCLYRPSALLPFPKDIIRRALSTLLDFVEGRCSSSLLDESIRTPEVAEATKIALRVLDDFIDVPPEQLPTDPLENAEVGMRIRKL